MRDLSDFQRGQIDGARMVGATVTKTAQLFEISRATILNFPIIIHSSKSSKLLY